ncbi:MAG TPA: protein kinase [Vicinamibacterales bacterium]
MPLRPGLRIGPYEVLALAGAGGMGEVYRARDTRLSRDVALKVLPQAVALDAGRLARFEREAQILATLGHSGIGGIFGVEQFDGGRALVLEYVEGLTLAERIEAGPLPVDEALAIARQMAEALEAAHDRGIVHRDLKPSNVKVRPDGTVKVLDFGLAKAFNPELTDPALADAPTVTSGAATEAGVILGTAAYMSPEQARGRAVDKRADNWSFGCVLYEMLTAARAFRGDTVADTLAAVVRSEPDWSLLPRDLPVPVRALLARCLDKDARRRLRDIGEARVTLESLADGGAAGGEALARRRRWTPVRVAAAAALTIVAAIAGGVVTWRLGAPARPVVRLAIVPPAGAPLVGQAIAITPDGRSVVYVSGDGTQLSVRALDSLVPRHLTGLGAPAYPFISPDGGWIGYFDGLNALKIVPIGGGPSITLCTLRGAAGRGAVWADDGHIFFATDDPATGLWRVPARGGTPEEVARPRAGQGDPLWPALLPDRRKVLVTLGGGADDSAQGPRIAVLDLESGAYHVLLPGVGARYVPTGHLIFGANGALHAVRFDPDAIEIGGTPVEVIDRIAGADAGRNVQAGVLALAVAAEGTLTYVPAAADAVRRLVWVDRGGGEELIPAPPRGYVIPRVSPDGSRIAVDTRDVGTDIMVWDVAARALSRSTFATSVYPVWTRDGTRLVHTTFGGARVGDLFLRAPDGSTGAVRLTDGASSRYAASVTPDGARVLFREEGGDTGVDIGLVPLDGGRSAESVLRTRFNEMNPELSRDGRWLAYESNESGQNEIYVRPFPGVTAGLWEISRGGGRQPAWHPEGRELFYRTPDGSLMAVPITVTPRFAAGQPVRVTDGRYYHAGPYRSYDVSPDGRRFLMIRNEATAARPDLGTIIVVQNGLAGLQ